MSEATQEQVQPTEVSASARTSTHSIGAWLIVLVLLGLAGAGGYGFYFLYAQQRSDATQLAQLKSELAETQQDARARQQQLQQDLESLRKGQYETNQQLAAAFEKNQRLREDWLLIDVEHLIKVANQQLILKRDVRGAIKALQAADERLKSNADPTLLPLRKILSEDLQALRSLPQADLTGISLTLSTLAQDVERLPMQTPDPQSLSQANEAPAAARQVESWSQLPAAIWADLKSLIVFRNHEEPVKALLTPEQRLFLTENLRLQLEQARLALLNNEAAIYKERLISAQTWIGRYFDKKAKPTQAALEMLQRLQQENIAPELPEITRAYTAIQRILQKRELTR